MIKSISYWSFPDDLSVGEILRTAKDLGYQAVELTLEAEGEICPTSSPDDIKRIKELAEDIGIATPTFATGLGWQHPAVGADDAAGAEGLLLVRGPSIFEGYLNYDGASPFVDFDGKSWYRTGDLVREDADGVLTFAGRLKRFVKLGGEMISLPAIEAVLEPHFAGEDEAEGPAFAVVSTAADDRAEIVMFTTRDVDRETVNGLIRDAGLSGLHNVRRVIRLDQPLPLLGTGKTDYQALAARLADS